jgi:large subunit ribosomal protein L16
MLSPKNTKFRKVSKGRIKGKSSRGDFVCYGDYGVKAASPDRVTSRQIEAARRAITRYMKRAGNLYIRIFPDTPVSGKPAEVRQGKGKGSIEYWCAKVKPGRIIFEISGVSESIAKEAFRLGSQKLPLKTLFVDRKIRGESV